MDMKTKIKLFQEMLTAETFTTESRTGLFEALTILGLSNEYINWSYNKTARKVYKPFVGEIVIIESEV